MPRAAPADSPRASTSWQSGTTQSADGARQLATGASQLGDGGDLLATGAQSLADGVAQLATGTDQLATGLQTATDPVPVYTDTEAAEPRRRRVEPGRRGGQLHQPLRRVRDPAARHGRAVVRRARDVRGDAGREPSLARLTGTVGRDRLPHVPARRRHRSAPGPPRRGRRAARRVVRLDANGRSSRGSASAPASRSRPSTRHSSQCSAAPGAGSPLSSAHSSSRPASSRPCPGARRHLGLYADDARLQRHGRRADGGRRRRSGSRRAHDLGRPRLRATVLAVTAGARSRRGRCSRHPPRLTRFAHQKRGRPLRGRPRSALCARRGSRPSAARGIRLRRAATIRPACAAQSRQCTRSQRDSDVEQHRATVRRRRKRGVPAAAPRVIERHLAPRAPGS